MKSVSRKRESQIAKTSHIVIVLWVNETQSSETSVDGKTEHPEQRTRAISGGDRDVEKGPKDVELVNALDQCESSNVRVI
jgi:hypothetical protein